MVAGQQVTARLGWTSSPEGSLAEQFLHAEATNLQLGFGMALAHPIFGNGARTLEQSLDLSLRTPELTGSSSRENPFSREAFAMAMGERSNPYTDTPPTPLEDARIHMAQMTRLDFDPKRHVSTTVPRDHRPEFLTASQKATLRQRYLHLLSEGSPKSEAQAHRIISHVLETPSRLTEFHERLLEAVLQAPNRNTPAQSLTIQAIRETFSANPLETGCGTFHQMMLQQLLGEAMTIQPTGMRNAAALAVFEAMESGLTMEKMRAVFTRFNLGAALQLSFTSPVYSESFWRTHFDILEEVQRDVPTEHLVSIMNFVYRSAEKYPDRARRMFEVFADAYTNGHFRHEDVDRAFAFAGSHPFAFLVMQRLFQILAIQDTAAKLREIHRDETHASPESSARFITTLFQRGWTPEAIAEQINGTFHTAYSEDLRLARKTVSVTLETAEAIQHPERYQERRKDFEKTLESWMDARRRMEKDDLYRLIGTLSPDYAQSLEPLKERIRIKTDLEMLAGIRERGLSKDTLCFFLQNTRGTDQWEIWVRELFSSPSSSLQERNQLQWEAEEFMDGFIHEGEHSRHYTGNSLGIERGAEPFRLGSISRKDRLSTETMAYLEEQRLRFLRGNFTTWELARRLGVSMPQYLGAYADRDYYHPTNRSLLEAL